MPMFVVNTNVAKSDVPASLLSEATEELAKAMGKPAQVMRAHPCRTRASTMQLKAHCVLYGSVCCVIFSAGGLNDRRLKPDDHLTVDNSGGCSLFEQS